MINILQKVMLIAFVVKSFFKKAENSCLCLCDCFISFCRIILGVNKLKSRSVALNSLGFVNIALDQGC